MFTFNSSLPLARAATLHQNASISSFRCRSHSDFALKSVVAIRLFSIEARNNHGSFLQNSSARQRLYEKLDHENRLYRVKSDEMLHLQTQKRKFCSARQSKKGSNNKRKEKDFQLDALPFSITPDQALVKFHKWAVEEQGLSFLLSWNVDSVKISASYVPVWVFDVNVRFARFTTTRKQAYYDWKPPPFDKSHKSESVIHLSGLAAYAGYTYRRSLINPIHNSSLIFLGDQKKPFQAWMLNDVVIEQTGERLEVFPDPWNATKERAFSNVRDDLEAMVETVRDTLPQDSERVQVQVEKLSYRRMYMPTFVVDYSILGLEYRAFLSGCDANTGVSGVSHQVFPSFSITSQDIDQAYNTTRTILTNVSSVTAAASRGLGRNVLGSITMFLFNIVGNVAARFLARLPVLSVIGGIFVGFRKIIQPWMDNRSASAEWERQRDHEQYVNDDHFNDFVDDFSDVGGKAQRYFRQHKKRILHEWSEPDLDEERSEWYSDWEKWSKQQWDQQEQEGKRNHQEQQYQRKKVSSSKGSKQYTWDFDPNDPYSVLGIHRGASTSEVSAAFRKEMLKHHPDVQSGVSDEDKERAIERSKYITEAYRKIKTEMKTRS